MFETILQDVYSIIDFHEKQDIKKKKYNIFKVLEMTDREVMMCRVLTDFLNPQGAHGKGNKYLRIFLRDILKREDYDEICADAHVYKEYVIAKDRRIDIVIEAANAFIPIEVKIHAGDQKAQCYDYYDYAQRKDIHSKVIYLTKSGKMPSEDSLSCEDKSEGMKVVPEGGIQCISFADDICRFMKLIIDSEQDTVIREIACEYLDAINSFIMFSDEELKMDIVEELCKNEQNFKSMLLIEQVTRQAKTRLLMDLMKEMEGEFDLVMEQCNLKKETNFHYYEYQTDTAECFYDQKGSTYPGLNYVFQDITLPYGMQLWFRIEIDNNLCAGLCLFDTEKMSEVDLKDQSDDRLKEVLFILQKLICVKKQNFAGWWLKWWYLPSAKDSERLVDRSVPNFKDMNEAVIALADREKRTQFVKQCVKVILDELKKIVL